MTGLFLFAAQGLFVSWQATPGHPMLSEEVAVSYEIEVKHVDPRPFAAVRFRATVAEMPQHIGEAFGAVMAYLQRIGAPPDGPAVARYDIVAEGDFEVAAGFYVPSPIEGDGHVVPVELPAGDVARTTHIGPYEGLPQAYEAIEAWMKQNDRESAGSTMWEEYLTGPETPPEQTRTEIYWPLKPRRTA
jgi:effector-binding domain-containing protein